MDRCRCAEYAKLELQHIQLEIRHDRYQHLRHFVDQYYCYCRHIVKRTGRADWEGVVWKGIVSVAARSESARKRVVKEHVVPLKVITTKLQDLAESGKTSLEDIAKVLKDLTHFGTITKEEDAKLRKAGVNRSMPDGYFQKGHPYHNDILARYKEARISLEPVGFDLMAEPSACAKAR